METGGRRRSRSDEDEGSGDRNDENLLDRSEVRNGGCVDEKGKEGAVTFDGKSLR